MAERCDPERLGLLAAALAGETVYLTLRTGPLPDPPTVGGYPTRPITWTTGGTETIVGWSFFDSRVPDDDDDPAWWLDDDNPRMGREGDDDERV